MNGGAIYALGHFSIADGTNSFTSNTTSIDGGLGRGGGAIFALYGATITGGINSFTGNSAASSGGALYANYGIVISGGTNSFEGNNTAGGSGGAIFAGSANINGGNNRFTNNTAGNRGGAMFVYQDTLLRATDGDFLFRGNIDSTNSTAKANAIYVFNENYGKTLTLSAESGRKIELFDPITSNSSYPDLTININPTALTDTGSVIFDGSYWKGKGITDANYFTTKLYGNATLGYGTLEIKNGAIFDVSGSYTQAVAATLGVGIDGTAAALKANSATLAGTLNIVGYDGTAGTVTILETVSAMSTQFATVNIAGASTADFLSAVADYSDNKKVQVTTVLTWNKTDGTQHGDFTITNAGDSFTLGAVLADNTAGTANPLWDGTTLTKKGAGTLILTSASGYTGTTTISEGQITAGAVDVLKNSSGVTLAGTAKFATGDFNQEVKNLVGGANNEVITGSAATHILTLNNASDTTFAGVISGSGSLTKTGAGKLTLTGANSYSGNSTISAGTLEVGSGGSMTVVANTNAANSPIRIASGAAFSVTGTGKLTVDANATQLGALVAGTKTPFYFADTKVGLTVPSVDIHTNINQTLYTVDSYVANDNFLNITRIGGGGGGNRYLSPSVNAAFGSYTAGNGNALLDDVHTSPNSEYETAERVELAYNAASGVGAAHQGVAALSGFYSAMDNVFAGSFSRGGGGVYRGQVCEPCSQVGCLSPKGNSASRREAGYQNKAGYLERAVWVMPIYGHQSAADLHSGGVKYGYTSDQYAAVFGTEVKSGHTRFGIAGNAGIGRTVSPGAAIHTNSDLTFGGVSLYAVQKFGRVESNTQVGWIGTRNEMRQRNGAVNVNADIDGGLVFAAVNFERPSRSGDLTFTPVFGLEFTHIYQNSFATNAGGTAIFTAQSGDANMLHIPFGLKVNADYATRIGSWSPSVRARVLPNVGDTELAFTNLSTGTTTAATLYGVVADSFAGDMTFGSTLKRGRTEIGGAYTVLFSEHFTNQNVGLMVKRVF